jgi:hypothetical protein
MNIYWLKKLRGEANRKIQACFDNGYIKIIKKLDNDKHEDLTCSDGYYRNPTYMWNGGYSYSRVQIKPDDIDSVKDYLMIGRRLYILDRLRYLKNTRKNQYIQETLNKLN